MAHYYSNPNYQCYPPNYYYSYDDQPYYSDHHSNYNHNYSSSNYVDDQYVGDQWAYGGYSNEQYPSVRYDQYPYYNSQFQSKTYQHFPSKSFVVYHNYNSAGYDNHLEFPAKGGTNLVDPDLSTGFVVSYSETAPNPDLEFEEEEEEEEHNPEHFQGGYNMTETYGKPLPPTEDICYPPSKFDLTPPPPSPFGKGDNNLDKPVVKVQENEDEDQSLDCEEDEDENEDEDDDDDDEEEEAQNNVGGVLIAPSLPGKEDKIGSFVDGKTREEQQPLKPQHIEEEDVDDDDEEEEEEEEDDDDDDDDDEEKEEKTVNWEDGRVEEKEIIRRQIPPGYGLEAMDLCEGVFGGYFPCLRKRNQVNAADQGGSNSVIYGNEDANGDCWKTTMDYLFGDPDPYARAMPDPVYGYQRYYPQQPITEQVQYGGDYTWSTNPGYYYGHNNNGEGY